MALESVDFPQPDSPTRPSVSPAFKVSDTPSTARTGGALSGEEAAARGEMHGNILDHEDWLIRSLDCVVAVPGRAHASTLIRLCASCVRQHAAA